MIRRGIAAVMLLVATGAWAKSPSLEAVLDRVDQADRDMQTFRFDFTQSTKILLTGQTVEAEGTAVFQKPNRFRVEQRGAAAQTVVTDGQTLWVFLPTRGQEMKSPLADWSRQVGLPKELSPVNMGAAEMRQRYDVTLDTAADGPVLRLSPKDPGPWPYTIRVWVDMKTGLVRRTELTSASATTALAVTNPLVNPALPPEVFQFKAPSGVEIFDMPSSKGKN